MVCVCQDYKFSDCGICLWQEQVEMISLPQTSRNVVKKSLQKPCETKKGMFQHFNIGKAVSQSCN